MVKIPVRAGILRPVAMRPEVVELLKGRVRKLASTQVDKVDEVSFKGSRGHHRLSFQYDRDVGENVAKVIDNFTGETVKHIPSATQVDHKIRIKRLMGLHLDKKA